VILAAQRAGTMLSHQPAAGSVDRIIAAAHS
jgi:hypothetical protein